MITKSLLVTGLIKARVEHVRQNSEGFAQLVAGGSRSYEIDAEESLQIYSFRVTNENDPHLGIFDFSSKIWRFEDVSGTPVESGEVSVNPAVDFEGLPLGSLDNLLAMHLKMGPDNEDLYTVALRGGDFGPFSVGMEAGQELLFALGGDEPYEDFTFQSDGDVDVMDVMLVFRSAPPAAGPIL